MVTAVYGTSKSGIGILAFRQLSGIAAFHKIVTRFYSVIGIFIEHIL